jgi:hypothetical protein
MSNRMNADRRWDRTVRSVMWVDAVLSVAAVVVSIVAAPLVAVLGVPHAVLPALGTVAIVSAVVLAGCGAVTAVALTVRMHHGEYLLPPDLQLPLPPGLKPPLVTRRGTSRRGHRTRSWRPPSRRQHRGPPAP